jgi:hypothetical protein
MRAPTFPVASTPRKIIFVGLELARLGTPLGRVRTCRSGATFFGRTGACSRSSAWPIFQ